MATWVVGSGVASQQVGNIWTEGDEIVSLSMSGDLNVFDRRAGDKVSARVLQAPSKAVTAAAATSPSTFYAGVADGRVLSFSDSEYSYVEGTTHTNLVAGIAVTKGGKVYSAGLDDKVREIEGSAFV